MKWLRRTALLFWLGLACIAPAASAQTPIPGSALALKSTGSGASSWTLQRNGYVGTYLNVAEAGAVTVRVNASGTASGDIAPHMNIVLADTKAGFNVAAGVNSYEHTFDLPAGTYLLRTEFTNDLELSPRSLTVEDVAVTGATVSNTSSNSNALAASNTYIDKFRKGNTSVGLSGVAPGTVVNVSLKRHDFNFGAAVPGHSTTGVNDYLGSNGTVRQTNYQARLNLNFNALVPENAGKWANNEGTRDSINMNHVDQILNYAQSHNMRTRMHNLLWGDNSFNGQQPSWVLNSNSMSGLLDQAYLGTNPNAAADLRVEISERIDYYVGTGAASDRSHKIVELDVYNESYHTGADPNLIDLRHNYWNVYGATGVADIYREVREAVEASGATTKIFVNEYGVLGSNDYGNWYFDHVEAIRRAGVAAGYGDVVGGIGVQHYPGGSQSAGNMVRTLQNLSVQGLPIALTEFGVSNGVAAATAATILGDSVRMVFGTADATGFFMWGFHDEGGNTENMFAPAAALYQVANPTGTNPDFTNWTLTPAGQTWQDLLGIQDWDGNPNNGWTTQLNAVVDANGTIDFTGFWGDYELTIDGQTYSLAARKGEALQSLVVAAGDFNGDGVVDAADYVVWRETVGSPADLRADGNGDRQIDESDYGVWRSHFGQTYGSSSASLERVPEPSAALLLTIFAVLRSVRMRRAPRPLFDGPLDTFSSG